MVDGIGRVRLRQAVLVARELEPLVAELRDELGLQEPFRDPGVAEFGLANAVFALEDCFLEVVSPVREGTAGGRHLDRIGGDGGYMVIFDLEQLADARLRAEALGVRVVWQIDLPDISGTHLHPGDMRGAIVSIDRSEPYGTWRWGGPAWTGARGAGAPAQLLGITIADPDPEGVAARWAEVLGVSVEDGPLLRLDSGEVRFRASAGGRDTGLTGIALALPAERRRGRDELRLGGVRLTLSDL